MVLGDTLELETRRLPSPIDGSFPSLDLLAAKVGAEGSIRLCISSGTIAQ
jgi:hypothetical protein